MPRNPAPQMTDSPKDPAPREEPSGVVPRPDEFDPTTVKVGHITDPAKIAAKIEAARLKHAELQNAVKVCIEAGAKPKPIEEEPPAPPVQVIERRIETVSVEIPLGEPLRYFQDIHIAGRLVKEHAQTWARLRQALRDKGAKTEDGKDVRTEPDILRWLMEKFSEC